MLTWRMRIHILQSYPIIISPRRAHRTIFGTSGLKRPRDIRMVDWAMRNFRESNLFTITWSCLTFFGTTVLFENIQKVFKLLSPWWFVVLSWLLSVILFHIHSPILVWGMHLVCITPLLLHLLIQTGICVPIELLLSGVMGVVAFFIGLHKWVRFVLRHPVKTLLLLVVCEDFVWAAHLRLCVKRIFVYVLVKVIKITPILLLHILNYI